MGLWLVVNVKNGSKKAYCSICNKDLVVGKSELVAHTNTMLHMQTSPRAIDGQWRSLLIDLNILNEGWKDTSMIDFWKLVGKAEAYKDLSEFCDSDYRLASKYSLC